MKILWTGDWHIREDRPRCRIDESWKNTQENILNNIINIANIEQALLLVGGDVFHRPRTTPEMETMVSRILNKCKTDVGLMAGNHDLPYHSLDLIDKSSFGVISHSRKKPRDFLSIDSCDWSEKPPEKNSILCLHQLTFPSATELPPNVDATTAQELLSTYPSYNWILTADYHKNFHYENNGRHVVNAGCITRQAADFKEYKPVVSIINTGTGEVQFIETGDDKPVIIDTYLKDAEIKEERVAAFIEAVKKSGAISLDFEENVKRAIAENQLPELTKKQIHILME